MFGESSCTRQITNSSTQIHFHFISPPRTTLGSAVPINSPSSHDSLHELLALMYPSPFVFFTSLEGSPTHSVSLSKFQVSSISRSRTTVPLLLVILHLTALALAFCVFNLALSLVFTDCAGSSISTLPFLVPTNSTQIQA